MIAFQAGPWRTYANHPSGAAQQISAAIQRRVHFQDDYLFGALAMIITPALTTPLSPPLWLARPVGAIDVAVAETSAIAQEITIEFAVIAILDASNLAVAFPRADIAAHRALMADAGRELHIPLANVAVRVGLVSEHAGGAHFSQVAGKRALQNAFFVTPEIQVVIRAEDTEISASSIIVVEAHAAIAVNAAIHLMGNKRPQILVMMGALATTVAAPVVAGHHRHVLQMAVTALFADRAVVGMIGHQPLHHVCPKCLGFLVVDGDPAVV